MNVFSGVELDRFRSAIAQRTGLWFDDQKFEQLANVLARRLAANGETSTSYLAKLEAEVNLSGELRELAQELTVGETYFFRHTAQFCAFSQVALPSRLGAREVSRQIRLLSAGCSSGEEAYTLSILTRAVDPHFDVAIQALDINSKSLERARRARYSPWALRETPEEVQRQHFIADGRDFLLSQSIRDSVRFEEGNLVGDDSWVPESFDVIFCRNVLMYLTPDHARRVVGRFARALAAGGFLFLGHAENLRGLSEDFDLQHTHDTFYYRRRGAVGNLPLRQKVTEAVSPAPRSALAPDWTRTWLETVQQASERIRVLTEKPITEKGPSTAAAISRPMSRVDLSLALELLTHERFEEALEAVARRSPGSANDADAVLLRAALLTHCGRLEAAETACAELLLLDASSAGAYYLRSLCRERQSDTRAAIEYAQAASYLDVTFAMPHLHLGLIARRTGDRTTAQRELEQALLLLQEEDASRLLLFGGGFSREGLATLCRSELVRLGGST